jgi:XisI protein
MDNTLKYSQTIEQLMYEYAEHWGTYRGVTHQALIDNEHKNYALITLGWETNKHRYSHSILFHIQVIDGKVWVHQNETEEMIADELIEKGVAREDIVLGFLPERDRAFSGFATA